jgi:hypothetical protein
LRTADLSATVASRTGSFDEEKKVKRRAMAPMTKEDYEKEESRIRQVFDPETGRMRYSMFCLRLILPLGWSQM